MSIHDQVDADTSSGSSHGTRNSARRMPDSRKVLKKNTASPRPIANWKAMETKVKIAVLMSAGANVGLWIDVDVVGEPRERGVTA